MQKSSDLKCQFECKNEDDAVGTFTGIASTSDADSDNDVIEAGAFEPIPMKSGPGGEVPNVLMLRDHDRTQIIGGWRSFRQQCNELLVEGELCLAVPKARETHELMKHGFLSGISVCFTVSDRNHISVDQKSGRRTIKKATLRECSIVGFPANANARITSVKSEVDSWLIERGFESGDLERLLRRLKQGYNDEDPPDPKAGEGRDGYMRRCLSATGGDMEGCQSVWDDWGEDDAEEKRFDEHLLPSAKWASRWLKKADPKKPWGDVDYADPGYQEDGVHRYPIDVKWRIRAAWNRIHQRNNRSPYTADQLDRIEARIIAAWKKKIDPDGPPAYQEENKSHKTRILAIDGHHRIEEPTVASRAQELMAHLSKRAHR